MAKGADSMTACQPLGFDPLESISERMPFRVPWPHLASTGRYSVESASQDGLIPDFSAGEDSKQHKRRSWLVWAVFQNGSRGGGGSCSVC